MKSVVKKRKRTSLSIRLITSTLLVALLGSLAFIGSSASEFPDETADIKAEFDAEYLVQPTVGYTDDYVGSFEYTVYHGGGEIKTGVEGTPVIVYTVNHPSAERVGTKSNTDIIRSMLDRGYVVVLLDYLNTSANTTALSYSTEVFRNSLINGEILTFGGYSGGKSAEECFVCPSGCDVLLNAVFFEIDKHSTEGTLEKIVENWNSDFKATKGSGIVKWVHENGRRKTVANAADGSSPVWYSDAAGSTVDNENGVYTKVKYTVAEKITDCVDPDGSFIDMNLYINLVYPTSPESEVPVAVLANSSNRPTTASEGADVPRPHSNKFLYEGYANAVFDYMWQPMARTASWGYYDGSMGVTGDHMNYAIHIYNDKLINTAAIRYLRYISLADEGVYNFDLDSFIAYGNSKGGWFTFLGEEVLQSELATGNYADNDEREEAINERLSSFMHDRYYDGHHGETRYQAGRDTYVEDGITVNGGELQPWLTYNNKEIISGVQLTNACNGGQTYDISKGHVPVFISSNMDDMYSAAYGYAINIYNSCRELDIPLLHYEVPIGHTLTYGADLNYNIDTYEMYFKYIGFFMKGDAIDIGYINPMNKAGKVEVTDKITIGFTGTAEKTQVEAITVSRGGVPVSGVWESSFGGVVWTFTPDKLDGNTEYTVTVPSTFAGTNGAAIGTERSYAFITEYDKATELTASGEYYSFVAPEMTSSGNKFVFRFAVSNDAANVAELYAVESTEATSGVLLGKANLAGVGSYEIDITDFIAENSGKEVTLMLKGARAAGYSEVFSESFDTIPADTVINQRPKTSYEGGVQIGDKTVMGLYVSAPEEYGVSKYYANGSHVLTVKKITGVETTAENVGRRFVVSFDIYDTISRMLTVKLNSMTAKARDTIDYDNVNFNVTTAKNGWSHIEFTYEIYEPKYGKASDGNFPSMWLYLSSDGDAKSRFYIDNMTVTEVITDITVGSACIAEKNDGMGAYKAPTSQKPLAVYNGEAKVGEYATLTEAFGSFASGYTLRLQSDYALTDSDLYSGLAGFAEVNIDLSGYSVICENTKNSLIWIKAVNANKAVINISNGAVYLGRTALISYEASSSQGRNKEVDININGVNIGLTDNAFATEIISASALPDGASVKARVKLTDTVLNLPDSKRPEQGAVIFPAPASSALDILYSVKGGEIRLSSQRRVAINNNAAIVEFADTDGEYTPLMLPTALTFAASGAYKISNGYANYIKANDGEDNISVYELRLAEGSTPYGIIPTEYSDVNAYPFAVFKDGGVFVGAYSDWAAGNASSALSNSKDEGSIVLLRRNYTYNSWYSNISQTKTDTLVDLGGFTFTSTTKVFEACKKTNHNTGITIKNGSFVLTGSAPFIEFNTWGSSYTGGYGFSFDFEDVEFKLSNSAAKKFMLSCSSDSTSKAAFVSLSFTDCLFDISAANNTGLCFFDVTNSLYEAEIVLYGCEIKAANGFTFMNAAGGDPDSSITFEENESGDIATVTIPLSVDSGSVILPAGSTLVKKSDDGTDAIYGIEAGEAPPETETQYGTIPEAYASVEQYPFAVFRNGSFVGAYSVWGGGKDGVQSALTSSKEAGSVILLRRDFEYSGDYYNNLSQTKTNTVVDLGGFTFTVIHQPMFKAQKKTAQDTVFTVKNGTIAVTGGEAIIQFGSWHANNTYGGGNKFDFTFDKVNIKFKSGAGANNVIFYSSFDSAAAPNAITSNITLNECAVDLTEASKTLTLFKMAGELGKVNAVIKGGSITTSSSAVIFANKTGANTASSFSFGVDSDGNYTTLVMPSSNAAPTEEFGGLKFVKVTDDGAYSTYKLLPPSIITEYGEIPSEYFDANQYPFAVFRNGSFIGAYTAWGGKDGADSALTNSRKAGSVILLRRDFEYSGDYYNNLSKTESNTTVDLGGFTFTVIHQPMFSAQKKTAQDTAITVKNGNIVLSGGEAVIKLGSWNVNGTYAGGNKFDFIFDRVNIKLNASSTAGSIISYNSFDSNSAPNAISANIILNGCEIDLKEASKDITLFNMAGELGKVSAVINGGSILTGSSSVSFANTSVANADSSIAFGKADGGSYTTLSVPSGAQLSETTVNGGKYTFVLSSDNGTTATYALTPTAAFTPKASITLDSNLVLNIYIPNSEALISAVINELDGFDLSDCALTEDGEYYIVPIALAANEAANTFTLVVTVEVEGMELRGRFTFSVIKYAEKLLKLDTINYEETLLAKDILAYVRSAYLYFDMEDKLAVTTAINKILGDYDKTELDRVASSASSDNDNIISGVTFVLDSTPSIRFYLPSGANANEYSFRIGSRVLDFKTGVESAQSEYNGLTYCDVSLLAYQMIEEITVEKGSSLATYHINTYYDGVDKGTLLCDVVTKFYNYCVSAATYRQSVLTGTSYNSLSAEIVNQGGAAGTVAFVIDDGQQATAAFAKTMIEKYGDLKLTFAINGNALATLTTKTENGVTEYVMNDGRYTYTVNETNLAFWLDIVKTGRAEVISHTFTHAFAGTNDDGGVFEYVNNNEDFIRTSSSMPKGSLSKEILATNQVLRELGVNETPLTLAHAGIGVRTADYTVNGKKITTYKTYFNEVLAKAIDDGLMIGTRNNFIVSNDSQLANKIYTPADVYAGRVSGVPAFMIEDWTDPVISQNASYRSDINSWKTHINNAMEQGGLAAFCIHNISDTQEGFHHIDESQAEELFKYAAESNVAVMNFTEAVMYYLEWNAASISTKLYKDEYIVVSIFDGLDNNIYNEALTVKVYLPTGFSGTPTLDGNALTVSTDANGSFVLVDVVPDTADVIINLK